MLLAQSISICSQPAGLLSKHLRSCSDSIQSLHLNAHTPINVAAPVAQPLLVHALQAPAQRLSCVHCTASQPQCVSSALQRVQRHANCMTSGQPQHTQQHHHATCCRTAYKQNLMANEEDYAADCNVPVAKSDGCTADPIPFAPEASITTEMYTGPDTLCCCKGHKPLLSNRGKPHQTRDSLWGSPRRHNTDCAVHARLFELCHNLLCARCLDLDSARRRVRHAVALLPFF